MKKISMALGLMLALPAAWAAENSLYADFKAMMDSSFQSNGIADKYRMYQLDFQKACSNEKEPSKKEMQAIEAAQLKTVRYPADGKYMGDWKEGEKIAISGRGLTWTDKTRFDNGGGCYNCHQIDKKEISFGTIGPSLYNFGKLRGVSDPNSPASKAIVEYTWGKIWNAKAYNACSNMPRAGHMGIMTEAQVADLVALLLDPKSPVNQ